MALFVAANKVKRIKSKFTWQAPTQDLLREKGKMVEVKA